MHLTYRNVNCAFRGLVSGFANGEIPAALMPSRNGNVLQAIEPMTITYQRPLERALFNAARDANPFFHVFEALWMLAGRNDVKPLLTYVSDFDKFSDDRSTLNGAYGYRWRHATVGTDDRYEVDQLAIIADNLNAKPGCRRQVLQMWNVEDDLLKTQDVPCNECKGTKIKPGTESIYCKFCSGTGVGKRASKDVCCNTHAYFSVRPGQVLDMTVCNRSNDLILGMLGANVVHFSFLQEYMAARCHCTVGVYNQFTNNLHAYEWNFKPDEWLAEYENRDMHSPPNIDVYQNNASYWHVPLVQDVDVFDKEVKHFIDAPFEDYKEPFLRTVASPMMQAHKCHKGGKSADALELINRYVGADDWKAAAAAWITRRVDRKAKKEANERVSTSSQQA